MIGAVIIAGCTYQQSKGGLGTSPNTARWDAWHGSVASVPVLGLSTIARMVESLRLAGVDEISVVGENPRFSSGIEKARIAHRDQEGMWRHAAEEIGKYQLKGCDAVLVVCIGSYIECNWLSLFEQHREQGEPITRTFDQEGALDLWVVNPAHVPHDQDLAGFLQGATAADCQVEGYVNRLHGARDLRRMVTDIFTLKCYARPQGFEVRPGVWLGEGAQVARNARIVAPAFIGCGVKIGEDCLITRCSNVEMNSYVDFGTAIEDSSILGDTYVGIGLDLSHSVVDGGDVLNLQHHVHLRITDPVVMRRFAAKARQDSQIVFEERESSLA
jgi:NDP-sugar pyrophosphorylase family protein